MKASQPAAVTQDIAHVGFQVLHRFRGDDINGGGVALVYADFLRVSEVPVTSIISSVDCLSTRIRTRRGRLNMAAIYRPQSSSKYAVSIGQLCDEFGVLLDELLAPPGQLVICGDFLCPGDGANGVDARLLDTFWSHNLTQRIDRPTHRNGGTLDLLAHLACSVVASDVDVIVVGFPDQCLVSNCLH
jgi:hypothetical protein